MRSDSQTLSRFTLGPSHPGGTSAIARVRPPTIPVVDLEQRRIDLHSRDTLSVHMTDDGDVPARLTRPRRVYNDLATAASHGLIPSSKATNLTPRGTTEGGASSLVASTMAWSNPLFTSKLVDIFRPSLSRTSARSITTNRKSVAIARATWDATPKRNCSDSERQFKDSPERLSFDELTRISKGSRATLQALPKAARSARVGNLRTRTHRVEAFRSEWNLRPHLDYLLRASVVDRIASRSHT